MSDRTEKFHDTEEQYWSLIQKVQTAILLHDGQGRILTSNPMAQELLGFSEDQLIGMELTDPDWHFLREDGAVLLVQEYPVSLVLSTRRPLRGYVTGIRSSDVDEVVWMLVNAEPETDETGEISRVLVSFVDITERRRVEEALRISEGRYRMAQAIGHVGNWEYNLQTTEFWGSDEAKRIYGFAPAGTRFTTDEVENCIPERERVHQALVDLIETGKPYDLEFEIHPRNSSESRFIASIAELQRDEHGNPLKIVGVIHDITRRRKAEQAFFLMNHALDNVREAAFLTDEHARFYYVNGEACRILGYTREEMLGMGVSDIDSSFPAERWPDHWAEIKEKGSLTFESRHQDRDGHLIPVEVDANYFEYDGRAYNLAFARDITERKRAAETQHRLNRELQAISNCNQALMRAEDEQSLLHDICRIAHEEAGYDLVWVGYVDHDDAMTLRPVAWAGQGSDYVASANISWSADEERGQGPAGEVVRTGEILCIQDFSNDPRMAPWREAAQRQGYRSGIALPLKDENALTFGVLLIYSSERNAITPDELRLLAELAGDLSFGVTNLRSRAERKRAAQALSENEAKMRSILDNVGIGVTLISPQMKILELNRQMRRWFPSIEPTEHPVCYRAFNDPPREHRCDYCPTFNTLHDGLVHEATTETPQAGSVRNYRIISTPVFDESGKISGAIEMVEDITARLSLESQFRQAQKMEAVGRLAGGVAHDFNNMLGVILGHVELALDEVPSSSQILTDLLEIQKAATQSSNLTRQLLAFARKQTITPIVLDLNDTVADMISMLGRLIGEDIELAWIPDGNPCPVLMDPSQINQILVNLSVNARDAVAGIGKITIETTTVKLEETYCSIHTGSIPGQYVQLTVSDNGCGMDQEVLGNIFEPFFTTKGMGQGTGLGLSMVYGVVKQNQGFISVESSPGRGTAFQIFFPRHAGEGARSLVEASDQLVTGDQETILLVEDEAALLKLGGIMLRRLGYRVLAAGTPEEALHLAKEHAGEIDLLVTDVVMPEMTGRELSVRLLSLYPTLKMLFMSGYTANVIADHGILEKGVFFIQKPFSKRELGCKVREALGKA